MYDIFPGFYVLSISDIMKSRYMWIWTSLIIIFKVVSTEELKIQINVNNNTIESTAKFHAKERPSLIELQYLDFDGTVRIWTVFNKKVLLCFNFLQSNFFSQYFLICILFQPITANFKAWLMLVFSSIVIGEENFVKIKLIFKIDNLQWQGRQKAHKILCILRTFSYKNMK